MAEQEDELIIGSRAPEFRLPASTGVEIGLADYLGKSRVTIFFIREYI